MRGPSQRLGAVLVRPARLAAVPLLVRFLASALALAAGLTLAVKLLGAGMTSRAAAQPAAVEVTPQTDDSVPAQDVTMIGATPLEAPGTNETWGVGQAGSTTVLVRYVHQNPSTREGGWSLGPALLSSAGQPLSGFKLDASPLAGQMTPDGAGLMVGTAPGEGGGPRKVLLVRKPGGAFRETPPVPAEGEGALLKEGEVLFGAARAPLIAPLDEEGGEAVGGLLVPVFEGKGVEDGVLHWDGHGWTREPIEIPEPSRADFRVLAIGASSPANAWLLAQLPGSAYPAGAVALFRRIEEAGKWRWKPVTLAGGPGDGEAHPLTVPVQGGESRPFTVGGTGEPPTVTSQILTVTSEGVWIDGRRADVHTLAPASTTLFFKPAPAGVAGGQVQASWCELPSGVPAGTPACEHELPEALPSGPSRSIAWANGSPFGERVITGLPEGVSLRLDGDEFSRVLSLGATSGPDTEPGAAYGAAFSSPTEGWLGRNNLPVHLTTEPAPSRLSPWPVPFRHPLLAIAPQPGAPVGSLSSEALAVGDQGAVARYKPGEGWLPESLFGPGERVETPQLRAIAWPTPQRAYAVGAPTEGKSNQMWLWRGETGLWEADPATPQNFRGNLLGIAFDPSNPARGYAVGSSSIAGEDGILLRYGKTWTQEQVCAPGVPQPCLPPQVAGASFISIAFAGSQAIVAYRKRPSINENRAVGGLLLNDGSGWRVDEEAAAVMGGAVPAAVAALPDGGAAFTALGGPEGPRVYERESAGSSWQPTSTPLPRLGVGSLTLFREGGALRAIVSAGGVSNESEPQSPPPGFPPTYLEPFPPVGGGPQSGGVLRQTATGWSDEGHELNPAGEPAGSYTHHDLPYRPDPVLAVLIDPTGARGWAVGGEINSQHPLLETADVERYPTDGVPPPGAGTAPVPLHPVTFAIGGGAQCAAPCADRAFSDIGPDMWLSTALARAGQIGVHAFLYTGPRVTSAETTGPKTLTIPFAHEFARYAQILASSPIAAYAAASPQDLDARPESNGTEATFESAFSGFPKPFGDQGEPEREACAAEVGCEAAYYALALEGVRVIVLDDSAGVDETQLGWLAGQLASARNEGEPAIVVGNADLNAQILAGSTQAAAVARVLLGGGRSVCQSQSGCASASAYFYDSPEENVMKPLQSEGESIETFGSGTLGYVNVIDERFGDFHGASGFLLGRIDVAARDARTDRAPVLAELIPDIGELALEAKDGILLHRSEPALFDGLARRPRAGGRAVSGSEETEVDPYIPIPSNCVGAACATAILPEYTFSSSRPDIGGFVKPNLAAANDSHAVLQNAKGEPEREPIDKETGVEESKSGLFCAYNAGTTIVTISAGGLSSSLPVTVQAGSVRQPCGTVPLKHLPAIGQTASPAPPPAPAPAPAGPAPASAPPPVPLPPAPVVVSPVPARQAPRPTPPTPFFLPPALATPVLAFVPPPVPTPARPTPPSGTSAVTSPIEVAEHEEEEEEATESVSNQALAYRASEHEPAPVFVLGIVLIAAIAGASTRKRVRGGRREVRVAPATLSGMRAQRRIAAGARRRR